MKSPLTIIIRVILIAFACWSIVSVAAPAAVFAAPPCPAVVNELNSRLDQPIDEKELVAIIRSLNASKNTTLPEKFVTRKEAQRAGWKPGMDLWSVPALRGKSIGGDRFGNYEDKLPGGKAKSWREADLGYKGGKRGAKRIVFSKDGLRMVTVDHYKTFTEVPSCK
jgi:hypothetical protein